MCIRDSASSDRTLDRIDLFCQQHPYAHRLANAWNKGLCTAFNQGLALAKGTYVIDLSGDDVLLPCRIERQVAFFETLPEEYGVIFSNAQRIDTSGVPGRTHYPVDATGYARVPVPPGDVYQLSLIHI